MVSIVDDDFPVQGSWWLSAIFGMFCCILFSEFFRFESDQKKLHRILTFSLFFFNNSYRLETLSYRTSSHRASSFKKSRHSVELGKFEKPKTTDSTTEKLEPSSPAQFIPPETEKETVKENLLEKEKEQSEIVEEVEAEKENETESERNTPLKMSSSGKEEITSLQD